MKWGVKPELRVCKELDDNKNNMEFQMKTTVENCVEIVDNSL